jgi:putative colanic acid biosynthesis UDP-glucose lipid carrier transferase
MQSVRKVRGLLRHYGSAQVWAQIVCDTGVALAALYVLGMMRNDSFNMPYQILAMTAGLLMVIVYQWLGIYLHLRTGGFLNEARNLLKAWFTVLFLLSVVGFITKTNQIYSREVLLKWSVVGYLGQLAVHLVLRFALRYVRSRGYNQRRALLVGTGPQTVSFAERLARNPWIGIDLVGYMDSTPQPAVEHAEGLELRYLGDMDSVTQVVKKQRINLVYLTVPLARSSEIEGIVRELMSLHVGIHWVPDMSAFELLNHSVREIEGQPILSLSDSPINGLGRLGKWVEDKLLALAILLLCGPVLAVIAAGIKLTSPGPVLFRQKRAGLKGQVIEVWKFRTMYLHDEPLGRVTQASPSDHRITPIGLFLRRTSLDEFPQFFNVLGGSMSIVGPRPHALEHHGYYEKQIEAYMLRHRIKPGITGWAQVNGLRGQTERLEKMENRVKYDLYYINNWSLGFDFMIIAMTAWAVVTGRNAY